MPPKPIPSPDPRRERKVYRGEALRAVAMPLGGIGTGTIALCGDGSLRQWQIHNRINHLACVPHSFFAVWAQRAGAGVPPGKPVARLLQCDALYHTDGPTPPPTTNDHLVPPVHRRLLERLPGVQATEFIGEYPIAELAYHDEALPVVVTLEAFNPFIPLMSQDSGLPLIVFNFTAANPTDDTVNVSLAASLQNAVGWDGMTPLVDTRSPVYGGNLNTLTRHGRLTAIHMRTTRLPDDDPAYGSMCLATIAPDATGQAQWDELDALWADFCADGRLSDAAAAPSPTGQTWNGALALPFSLAPGRSHTLTFLLAWHFPNRYVDYSQRRFGIEDDETRFWLGNQYGRWFRSALDVAEYACAHLERLSGQTRLARDTFYDTTLPLPLVDALTSQISVIRSPTCFWAEDGRFYGFEGGRGASTGETVGGSCPLNCTHVWNYEMGLARLFPPLERTMRETEWKLQQHPTGYLPHRVVVPPHLPRPWDRDLFGPAKPALDGLLGAVLKTYREYRACGDAGWLGEMWPSVTRALDHLWTVHDPDRRGVIEGEQPNTYDISIHGANTFIGTLYLAALRAIEAMAGRLGERELAADCDAVYRRGRETLEQRLWNGDYYVQDVDLEAHPEHNWGTGCHADQLLGQWWAHLLGLGHLLDPDRVRKAAASIHRHNFREHFRDHEQRPRAFVTADDPGLLICTWPRGGRPRVPTLYSDEVWTGLEYEVAGLLLCAGEAEPGLRIVTAARARHDGRTQNPWNDIECGDHYVRAMASWALLELASGYGYDAAAGEIGFAPALTPDDYRAPFVARDGWGTFEQRVAGGVQEERITLAFGSLELKTMRFRPPRPACSVKLTIEDRPVPVTLTQAEGQAVLALAEPLVLKTGQNLRVIFSQA